MAVDQLKVVDIISTGPTGDVVLTISDHLDWSDTKEHLLTLQAKINTYLAFIESGEVHEKYPSSRNQRLVICVTFKYQPDAEGMAFLSKAKAIVEEAGIGFRSEVFPSRPV